MHATKLHEYDLDLLNTAVAIVLLMPFFAEQAASLSLEYHMEIKLRISPVADVLLFCSHCSIWTNFAYTPKPFTISFFYKRV